MNTPLTTEYYKQTLLKLIDDLSELRDSIIRQDDEETKNYIADILFNLETIITYNKWDEEIYAKKFYMKKNEDNKNEK